MNHTITIEVGDWSRDGHNQSDVFVYKCNYSQSDVEKAYLEAVKNGVPDVTTQCEEYEDNALGYEFVMDWIGKANSTHPSLLPLCQKIFQCSYLGEEGTQIDSEDTLHKERLEALSEEFGYDLQAHDGRIDSEDFVAVYLYIASTVLTDLKYDVANREYPLRIGGYGLFYG